MTALAVENTGVEQGWLRLDHSARRIIVRGELDLATYPILVDVALAFQRINGGDLIIDLDAVTFIDAGTLGGLVLVANILRTRRAQTHIIGNGKVQRIAHLCGLDSLVRPKIAA